jgi:hypothetical protein
METDGWPPVDRSAKQMGACELTGTECRQGKAGIWKNRKLK